MVLTSQSLVNLTKCKAFYHVSNIGPIKDRAERQTLSKLVVVVNVTLSFAWFAVLESHRAWWTCLVHMMRIAWPCGEKDFIVEGIHNAVWSRRRGCLRILPLVTRGVQLNWLNRNHNTQMASEYEPCPLVTCTLSTSIRAGLNLIKPRGGMIYAEK